jgi:hypothetical protein
MIEPRAARITVLVFVLAAVAYKAAVYIRNPLFSVSGWVLYQQVFLLVAVAIGLYGRAWRTPSRVNLVISAFALAVVVYACLDGWRRHLLQRDPAVMLMGFGVAVAIAFYLAWPYLRRGRRMGRGREWRRDR